MRAASKVAGGLVALALVLAGCANQDADVGAPVYPPPVPVPGTSTYQVPSTECPVSHTEALTVSTSSPEEQEYLDEIVACTTPAGDGTYLKNNGSAVWTLSSPGTVQGSARWQSQSPKAASFREILAPQPVLLLPGGEVTATVRPDELSWELSLPLSVTWEAHELLWDKISSLGVQATIARLNRTSPTSAALAQCVLAVHQVAKTRSSASTEDPSVVLLNGLASAVAGFRCRDAAGKVPVVQAGTRFRTTLLADMDLRVQRQAALLAAVESRLGYAARAARVLKHLSYLPRV